MLSEPISKYALGVIDDKLPVKKRPPLLNVMLVGWNRLTALEYSIRGAELPNVKPRYGTFPFIPPVIAAYCPSDARKDIAFISPELPEPV